MMGPVLPDVTHSINTDVKDCLEAVGTLPNWDKADARTMLEKTMDKVISLVLLFMPPYRKIGGHIVLPLPVRLSVRLSVCLYNLNVKT